MHAQSTLTNTLTNHYRATSFGVGVDFLLMMAQTLAERHTNQLMGLFRKAAVATSGASGTASPVTAGFPSGASVPDAAAAASGESMKRAASGSGNRPSSPTSIRRDSPLPRTSIGATPVGTGTPLKSSLAVLRPPVTSRSATPSNTATIPASAAPQDLTSSSRPHAGPKSPLGPRHRPSNLHLSTTSPPPQDSHAHSPNAPSSPAKSESSASSSSSSSPVESRIIKRPPRSGGGPKPATSAFPRDADDEDDDDDEAEPAFLPYKSPAAPAASAGSSDLGATLRGAHHHRRQQQHPPNRTAAAAAATAFLSSSREEGGSSSTAEQHQQQSQTSDSSASTSSPAVVVRRGHHHHHHHHHYHGAAAGGGAGKRHPGGPLSPRRTAELAGRSPAGKGKGKGIGREGSDGTGTPSMGSSFSDLDGESFLFLFTYSSVLHVWRLR